MTLKISIFYCDWVAAIRTRRIYFAPSILRSKLRELRELLTEPETSIDGLSCDIGVLAGQQICEKCNFPLVARGDSWEGTKLHWRQKMSQRQTWDWEADTTRGLITIQNQMEERHLDSNRHKLILTGDNLLSLLNNHWPFIFWSSLPSLFRHRCNLFLQHTMHY